MSELQTERKTKSCFRSIHQIFFFTLEKDDKSSHDQHLASRHQMPKTTTFSKWNTKPTVKIKTITETSHQFSKEKYMKTNQVYVFF